MLVGLLLPGRVFPARAGMNRLARCSLLGMICVPRARGDEPMLRNVTACGGGCSPRARG